MTAEKQEPNAQARAAPDDTAPNLHVVDERDADDTTIFYNKNKDNVKPLTPEIRGKVVRKNFWFLLIQTWWISFLIHLDKSTLSQASTMGLFEDTNMSKDGNEYNQLFTLFYLGYLIALWPGAWVSQRVGPKHFITGSLFLWALLIGVHPAVKTGKQMMAVRFLLGMVSQSLPCVFINILIWRRLSPRSYLQQPFSTRLSSHQSRVPGCSFCGGHLAVWPT